MNNEKLSIKSETAALDRKDRSFYDSLSDEEKKKFSPYLMLRYSACVEGNPDMQAWYLMATNERVNKNFFDISTSQHKKLQWLMCTTVSPDLGNQKHYWLPTKKTEKDNRAIKFLTEIYPAAKTEEIELLAKLNNKEDLRNLARDHGWDERRIKSDL
jgi:hypothetical protein